MAGASSAVKASSLLASAIAARSSTNPYKTLFAPIDGIVGPLLRPGFGVQISGPPGTHVEWLVVGVIKSVASAGKEIMVVDMQNKLKAEVISQALDDDERVDRVYYHTLHTLDEIVALLNTFPQFLAEHPQLTLLVLSGLSFPFQTEPSPPTRTATANRVRESIVKLCKQHHLVALITSSMAMHFVNPDGERGAFSEQSTAVMTPQIDMSCKAISSLVISRKDRTSGRAVFIPATDGPRLRVEFDFTGLQPKGKAT